MLADFFVADLAQALKYANRIDDRDEGDEIELLLNPARYKRITGLEIGTLWAILEEQEWDVSKHMPDTIQVDDEGASWLHRFPQELVVLLANANEQATSEACERWAKTEELDCDAADLRPLLEDLRSLARQAAANGTSVYLWGCL